MWILQEYTDDTAELRKQLDALGGMAALQDPETQLLALQDLEQFVSAVGHLYSAVHLVHGTAQVRHRGRGSYSEAVSLKHGFRTPAVLLVCRDHNLHCGFTGYILAFHQHSIDQPFSREVSL